MYLFDLQMACLTVRRVLESVSCTSVATSIWSIESDYQTETIHSYSRRPEDDDDSLDLMFADAEKDDLDLASLEDLYLVTLFPDSEPDVETVEACLDGTSEGKLSMAAALDVSLDAESLDALSLDAASLEELSLDHVSLDTLSMDVTSLGEVSLDGASMDEVSMDAVSLVEFLIEEQNMYVDDVVNQAVGVAVSDLFDAIDSSKFTCCTLSNGSTDLERITVINI